MFRRSLSLLRGKLEIGDFSTVTKKFTLEEVKSWLNVADDNNSIHLEGNNPILPGMMTSSLFSGIMGTDLPGEGSIYLSQSIKFRSPAYLNDTLVATVRVTKLKPGSKIIIMDTTIHNTETNKLIADGEAIGLNKNEKLWTD